MPKIYISYRRSDSGQIAARIYDRLVSAFGVNSIFKDIHSIAVGEDFRTSLTKQISTADVILIVIGENWLSSGRINDPTDFVRYEVETALERWPSTRVIPVLVNRAKMPNEREMSPGLRQLSNLLAIQIRDDPDFHRDVDKLINQIQSTVKDVPHSSDTTFRAASIAGVFALIAAIISGVFGLWQGVFQNNQLDVTSTSPGVSVIVTDTDLATSTATATPTLTHTAATSSLSQTETRMAILSETGSPRTLTALATTSTPTALVTSTATATPTSSDLSITETRMAVLDRTGLPSTLTALAATQTAVSIILTEVAAPQGTLSTEVAAANLNGTITPTPSEVNQVAIIATQTAEAEDVGASPDVDPNFQNRLSFSIVLSFIVLGSVSYLFSPLKKPTYLLTIGIVFFAIGLASLFLLRTPLVLIAVALGLAIGGFQLPAWFVSTSKMYLGRQQLISALKESTRRTSEQVTYAEKLIKAMDIDTLLPPLGLSSSIDTLVKMGIEPQRFNELTTINKRQERFRNETYKAALDDFTDTKNLQAAYSTSGLRSASLSVFRQLEDTLSPIIREPSEIQRIRAYAQLLSDIDTSTEDIAERQDSLKEKEILALKHLKSLVVEECAVITENYWSLYQGVSEAIRHAPLVPTSSEKGNRELARDIVDQVTDLINTVSDVLERHQKVQLPQNEVDSIQLVKAIGSDTSKLSTSLDFVEREKKLSDCILQLRELQKDQPNSYLALWHGGDIVRSHDNVWRFFITEIRERLEKIKELDEEYRRAIADAVTRSLKSVNSIEDLQNLDEQLNVYTRYRARYSPMLDDALRSLLDIDRDATAALAQLRQSYSRQLSLSHVHVKINDLRDSLHTNYPAESAEWIKELQRISSAINQALRANEQSIDKRYPNPYVVGPAIGPDRFKLFKGRTQQAGEIRDKLDEGINRSFLLYGARRMGKSSFLLQLHNLLSSNYIPVLCDALDGGMRQNDESFFYSIAYQVYLQMRSIAPSAPSEPRLEEYEKQPHSSLGRWLKGEVVPLLEKRRLLITIDEFDVLAQAVNRGTLTPEVFETLRSIVQQNQSVFFIYAGVYAFSELGENASSQFIDTFPVEIGYLTDDEAIELIRNPDASVGVMPTYSDDVVAAILDVTNRQPYLIQALCSEIIDLANDRDIDSINIEIFDVAKQQVLHRYDDTYFAFLWEVGGKKAHKLLRQLAENSSIDWKTELSSDELKTLVKHRVLKHDNGVYQIEIPLFANWIRSFQIQE